MHEIRLRRLRASENLRRLTRETSLSVDQLICPLFVVPGKNIKKEIPSMPGVFHVSVDRVIEQVQEVCELKIPGILLFGMPEQKDAFGTESYDPNGVVQQAIRKIKSQLLRVTVMTDVCLCAYTTHGHCGLVDKNQVLNDETCDVLSKVALSHVEAGADLIAPSDMMDGRVAVIRESLDDNGFTHTPLMSYAAKFASSFYGPFRDAQDSTPQFGDRRAYQLDPGNFKQALREVEADLQEGADIVMVKPALPYLDVIRAVAEMTDVPVAAYQVSGEYSMIHAAAEKKWIDRDQVILESLKSIRRAGADMIITYFAKEASKLLHRR